MQVFACLPKAQGFCNRNEVSHLPEFHWLITPDYHNDSKKVPHLISGQPNLTLYNANESGETAGGGYENRFSGGGKGKGKFGPHLKKAGTAIVLYNSRGP